MLLAALIVTTAARAAGGSLVTSDTRLDFPEGTDVQAITISNNGAAPIRVQARLLRWHDDGTGERDTPTADFGFSPALFALAPQTSQVIRFALLTPREVRESAYRLVIDQLPDAPGTRQVTLPVRLMIPVFVGSIDSSWMPHLIWSASAHGGKTTLTVFNNGAIHTRLTDLSYSDNGKVHAIQPGLAGYVLAGGGQSWTFRFRGTALAIAAMSEQGPIHETVPLTAP